MEATWTGFDDNNKLYFRQMLSNRLFKFIDALDDNWSLNQFLVTINLRVTETQQFLDNTFDVVLIVKVVDIVVVVFAVFVKTI